MGGKAAVSSTNAHIAGIEAVLADNADVLMKLFRRYSEQGSSDGSSRAKGLKRLDINCKWTLYWPQYLSLLLRCGIVGTHISTVLRR